MELHLTEADVRSAIEEKFSTVDNCGRLVHRAVALLPREYFDWVSEHWLRDSNHNLAVLEIYKSAVHAKNEALIAHILDKYEISETIHEPEQLHESCYGTHHIGTIKVDWRISKKADK
jgi:hypothetical protein